MLTNYELPVFERPTEQILDDDEIQVMTALKIFLNGYKIAQKRVRDITRAYDELEALTLSILKERSENKKSPMKNNIFGMKSSTPKFQDHQKKDDPAKEPRNSEMIDLTSLFDQEKCLDLRESQDHETSPILIETHKENKKKRWTKDSSPAKDSKRNLERSTSEISMFANRDIDISSMRIGNDENKAPFFDNYSESHETPSRLNKSRSAAKLTRTTTIYKIEMPKNYHGKVTKQSKLVFQPTNDKTSVKTNDKIVVDKTESKSNRSNLFDSDYRSRKREIDSTNIERSKKNSINNSPMKSHRVASSTLINDTGKIFSSTRNDETKGSKTFRKSEISLIIPTASQIDETARSLFEDDDDVDDFEIADDLKNRQNLNEKKNSIFDSIASTSKAPQFHQSESMDETFFAPAEINRLKNLPKTKSDASNVRNNDSSSTLKRKSQEEPIIDAGQEMDELALNDINWDAEISNDTWTSPKKAYHNSFDIPPEKTKKNLDYAYKGKVERNKAKRSKLRGWNCFNCEKYYENMNLPEDELKKRMDACSRHRSNYNPRYFTPKGFWDPEFPEDDDSSDSSFNYERNRN